MRLAKLTAALVAAGLTLPALAASDAATLEKLALRLEQLEARNAELEKEVKNLKSESEAISKGLDSPRLSQYEPELTVRLKAVEKDALEMKKASKLAEKFDGIVVNASLATVAERAYGLPKEIENGPSQLNYRADVSVELPLQSLGDIEQKVFAAARFGQGLGLNAAYANRQLFANTPNALAFRASGSNPDDSVAILGQAWYKASIPLPLHGFKPYSRETLELTFGKMDFFTFFDQNLGSGDEARQFLNSVFVHNPLLDAGRVIGVDANGFQPGFVASYLNYFNKREPWRISLGLFGTGEQGANYQRSLNSPLLMVQAEKQLKLFEGLAGNYRLYAFSRSKGNNVKAVDDGSGTGTLINAPTQGKQMGFGMSVDQRLGDGLILSGRYGHMVKGELPFNDALTIGAEINGSYWGRGADAFGIAGAWLNSGKEYRKTTVTAWLDDANTQPALSFTPRGAERVLEMFYRFRIAPQFELSPDFQYITGGGGDSGGKAIKAFSLRANLAY